MSDRLREALDAIARAEQAVDDLCQGRLRWEMRVPAEPDHDPDLIISEALRQARALLATPATPVAGDLAALLHNEACAEPSMPHANPDLAKCENLAREIAAMFALTPAAPPEPVAARTCICPQSWVDRNTSHHPACDWWQTWRAALSSTETPKP